MVNEDSIKTEQENKEGHYEIKENEDSMDFVELYEQSLQNVPIGSVVVGKVVQINGDIIMIDVGYKTEGQINAEELMDDDGNVTLSVGDDIEVYVDRKREDTLILSREKAVKMKVWDEVIASYGDNSTIQGTVLERVKGGFAVDLGIRAFLPGSQVDVRPVKDLDQFVGQTLDFQVLKYDRKRNNVVLSRKAILEREREDKKSTTLAKIEEGAIVEGVVKNITDYGVFIDLGGIDGLLHITDMSWGRIRHPSDNVSIGDEIKVKVLKFDREKERVSLGLKQLTENPWAVITDKFPIGSIVEGTVVNIMDYGVFIELESGIEGLIHISEMFWTKKMKHPSKVVSSGDVVKVMVLDIDTDNKRISLSLKQTMENPWNVLKENHPTGSTVCGKIRNITDFGMFVRVDDEIDGLVHISDISWTKRVKHPSEFYKKGDEIEAVVLEIDVENEKFSLGIKQMEKNPWEELYTKYGIGAVVSGKVTNVTDFGIFIEIEEGIEGLVHISELKQKKVKSSETLYSVGDTVSAVIKNIDSASQKVGLSVKDYETSSDNASAKKYVNNQDKVGSNLGDILAGLKV